HQTGLVLTCLGIYCLIAGTKQGDSSFLAYLLFAVVCFAFAWELMPRFISIPPGDYLPRKQFPMLYRAANRVAHNLGVAHVDGIVLSNHFNASYTLSGLRQRRVLIIGCMLWSVLDYEEKIALLPHELSHDANHDFGNELVVRKACQTLERLLITLTP